MALYKIYTIFLVLVLTQTIFCRPVDESSEELELEDIIEEIKTNGTDFEKLILSRMGNYMLIPQKYASKVVKATKQLLKDETLSVNQQPEVFEFKNKLKLFLDKYQPTGNLTSTHETMDYFYNITQPYFELSEDKHTPASKLISDLFNKYNFSKFNIKMDELEASLDEWRVTASRAEKLLIFTLDSLVTIPQQYAANATNVTRYLLKDEAFEGMDQPEVLRFKKNLNMFLDNCDPSTINMKSIYKSMDDFANITDYYWQLPEKKHTAETKFIVERLNKYDCKSVSMPFLKYMDTFLKNFIAIFEESKEHLEKPMLDWFEKFMNLTDYEKKILSMDEFITMV